MCIALRYPEGLSIASHSCTQLFCAMPSVPRFEDCERVFCYLVCSFLFSYVHGSFGPGALSACSVLYSYSDSEHSITVKNGSLL